MHYICTKREVFPYRANLDFTVSFLCIGGEICTLGDNLKVTIGKCWFTRNIIVEEITILMYGNLYDLIFIVQSLRDVNTRH